MVLDELTSKEEDAVMTVAFYNPGTMERHLPHMIFYLYIMTLKSKKLKSFLGLVSFLCVLTSVLSAEENQEQNQVWVRQLQVCPLVL